VIVLPVLASRKVAVPDVALMTPPGLMVHVVAASAVAAPSVAARTAAQAAIRVRA